MTRPGPQRRAVEELARARGYEPIVYEQSESAAKTRPVLDQLLDDVRVGKRQAVVVWALDRLHRSMAGCIDAVLELDRLGVPVLSVREPWLDTSGPVRSLLVAIFGWVAAVLGRGVARFSVVDSNSSLRLNGYGLEPEAGRRVRSVFVVRVDLA